MKLFKVSGYLLEATGQTVENLNYIINNNFDARQLHITESMPFGADVRLDDLNCDMAYLEEYFVLTTTEYYDRPIPKTGEYWRHFKGKNVEIIGIAEGTEYHELSVIYKDATNKIWSRPLAMFMSEVDHVKYPDAKQKYRFERVE